MPTMTGARIVRALFCLGPLASGCGARGGLSSVLDGDELPEATHRLELELALPNGRVGEPYSGWAEATDSYSAYTWSIVEGSLPPGLELGQQAGATLSVEGTPTLSGRFSGRVVVQVDTTETATEHWQITIRPKHWIVYAAHQQQDDPDMVYAVDTGSLAEPVWVGPERDEASSIRSLSFSPSGGLLTYDMEGAQYLVDLRGTAPAAPQFASRCTNWQWAPDERSALCRWNRSVIWAPIDDGRFGEEVSSGDGVRSSAWSPTSTRYAFNDQGGLFAVDVSQGASATPQRVHPMLVEGGHVSYWSFSPDGRWLVYEADAEHDDVYELYALRADEDAWDAPIKLNPNLTAGGDVGATVPGEEFDWIPPAWAPDSAQLAFAADAETDDEFRVFVVDMRGEAPGAARAVTAPLSPTVELRDITWVSEKHITYVTVTRDPYDQALTLVDVSAAPVAAAWQLNHAADPADTVVGPVPMPDGLGLVYGDGAFFGDASVSWYWVSWKAGEPSPPVKLYTSLSWNPGLEQPEFGPGTSLLAFSADTHVEGARELHLLDLDDAPLGPPIELHPPVEVAGRGLRCELYQASCQNFWREDARYVAYLLSLDEDNHDELFVVDASRCDGSSESSPTCDPPRKISHPLGPGGSVTLFAWPPG